MNDKEQKKQQIKESFYLFSRNMEPTYTFANHHNYIIDKIQNTIVADPKSEGRLLLSVPPGHSKSTICSQLLPAYILGVNPKARILLITYGDTLSNDMGVKCRRYMESATYRALFKTRIKGSGKGGTFDTYQGGSLKCIGRGGAITGFRADYMILDDTIKNQQEATSDLVLDGLWDWFQTVAYTRLVPPGKMLVFHTRWAEKDLVGRLIKSYPQWEYLNLEALCTDKETDPLHRDEGEALWPELYGREYLLKIKEANTQTFGALYQGNPTSEEACPIKPGSINTAATIVHEHPRGLIASWDTATKQNSGDYSVCTLWKDNLLYKVFRKQVDFANLLDMFDEINVKYDININLVEDASSGRQLISLRPDKCFAAKIIKHNTKISLAEAFNYQLKSGAYKINKEVLTEDVYNEFKKFPWAYNDDVVMSALHYYKNNTDGLLDDYKLSKRSVTSKSIFKKAAATFSSGRIRSSNTRFS